MLGRAKGQRPSGTAESKTLRMLENSKRENRESPAASDSNGDGTVGER